VDIDKWRMMAASDSFIEYARKRRWAIRCRQPPRFTILIVTRKTRTPAS